jgi:hypothetical protein
MRQKNASRVLLKTDELQSHGIQDASNYAKEMFTKENTFYRD